MKPQALPPRQNDHPSSPYEEGILRSLRRITRSIDLYSRQLAQECGLTGPQLVCLRIVSRNDGMPSSALAREMSLSAATVTGIVDRLAARKLLTRVRSKSDRRVVKLSVTPAGLEILARAPSLLQDKLSRRLAELPPENQQVIHTVLEQIVRMMGAEEMDAAPLLTTGPADAAAETVDALLRPSSPPAEPVEEDE